MSSNLISNVPATLTDAMKMKDSVVLASVTSEDQVSPFFKERFTVLRFSPDSRNGDCFDISGKKMHSKTAVYQIASAAGVEVLSTERKDDRSDPNYVEYAAVVQAPDGNGGFKRFHGSYSLDLNIIQEETIERLSTDKTYNNPAYKSKKGLQGEELAKAVKKEMLQKQKHRVSLCETGAILRAMRGIIGIKTGYAQEDFVKPMVVQRLVFSPDYSDPMTRNMALQAGFRSAGNLYQQAQPLAPVPQMQQLESHIPEPVDEDTGEIVDVDSISEEEEPIIEVQVEQDVVNIAEPEPEVDYTKMDRKELEKLIPEHAKVAFKEKYKICTARILSDYFSVVSIKDLTDEQLVDCLAVIDENLPKVGIK